jgi:hypothetical protein
MPVTKDDIKKILDRVGDGKTRKDLIDIVMGVVPVGRERARQIVRELEIAGFIKKEGAFFKVV